VFYNLVLRLDCFYKASSIFWCTAVWKPHACTVQQQQQLCSMRVCLVSNSAPKQHSQPRRTVRACRGLQAAEIFDSASTGEQNPSQTSSCTRPAGPARGVTTQVPAKTVLADPNKPSDWNLITMAKYTNCVKQREGSRAACWEGCVRIPWG
jgi:hypothetical protein